MGRGSFRQKIISVAQTGYCACALEEPQIEIHKVLFSCAGSYKVEITIVISIYIAYFTALFITYISTTVIEHIVVLSQSNVRLNVVFNIN